MATTLEEFCSHACYDAFKQQDNDNTLTMQLRNQSGTINPSIAQAVAVSSPTFSGTNNRKVRMTVNELFTVGDGEDWGVINRIYLNFTSGSTHSWNIYIRDKDNTANTTTWDMAAVDYKLTIRYIYMEFILST